MARKRSAEEAAAEHGWDKVERPKIEKWEKGMKVEGTYLGTREGGKYKTPLLKLSQNGKVALFGCPIVLQGFLEGIREGSPIRIVCLGRTIETERGQNAWDFEVYWKAND